MCENRTKSFATDMAGEVKKKILHICQRGKNDLDPFGTKIDLLREREGGGGGGGGRGEKRY